MYLFYGTVRDIYGFSPYHPVTHGPFYFRLHKHARHNGSRVPGWTLISEGADVEGEEYVKEIHPELYHEKGVGLWAILHNEVFPFFRMRAEVA